VIYGFIVNEWNMSFWQSLIAIAANL